MARVNHKKVRQLLNQERNSITDRQFFVSRILAGHFADIAAAQSKRYGYNRRVSVRIVWEPKNPEGAHTDNSLIWINAATPLVKAKKNRQERYEMVCGLFAHELGHVLYTDFLSSQTHATKTMDGGWYPERPVCAELSLRLNVDEIEEYRKQGSDHQMAFTRFSHHLHNVLEDGFIEEKMLSHFPGVLGANLNILRESVWEDTKTVTQFIEQEEDERMKWRSILQMMLSYCLYGEIKYGETVLTDERIQAVFRSLDDIDEGLTCTDPRVRWQMVNFIIVRNWHYIKPYLELCEENSKAMGGDLAAMLDALFDALNGTTSEGNGFTVAVSENGAPASGIGGTRSARRGMTAALAKPPSKEDDSEDDEGDSKEAETPESEDEKPSETGGGASAGTAGGDMNGACFGDASEAPADPLEVTEKEGGRIPLMQTDSVSTPNRGELERDNDYQGAGYDASAKDIEALLNRMAEERLETKRTSQLNELAQNISYGNIHEGVKMTVHRMSSIDDELRERYDEASPPLLSISKQLQRSITRQLQDQRRGGKQTGLYMGRRLDIHSLPRNDGRVFSKMSLPNETPELAIALLLDESGSMSCGSRATYARATAVILYDFCQSLGIPVMVYGHSTDSGVALYSYAEFDSIDKLDRYRMMDISARSNNRDGAALRFVAEQLAKRPEDIRLLILVSDGQPADSGYYGTAAEEDLRGIKTEYRRKGICFIAAAIGDDKDSIERIYGDAYMDISDLHQLPITLTNVVKRFIHT
ncbi:MAG TPA: nitric oxide reductase activation protein NorD [Clostridia bacterium]|nr:nitric oxide reductase activation protein NorD [Clostridia bacterium]